LENEIRMTTMEHENNHNKIIIEEPAEVNDNEFLKWVKQEGAESSAKREYISCFT